MTTSEENILSLAQKFIRIESVQGKPKELEKILKLALVQVKGFTVEHFEHNGVKSALAYNTKTRPKKFKVLLNTHLDVIPGKREQYVPRIQGKKLYGVGAMDMKANVACAIEAFKDVAKRVRYPLAIQFVTDEEVGGFDGTKYQVDTGIRADFVLATEPTNFDIVHKAKGILWVKITAQGKTAHGAYPWRGDNAIVKINRFLSALEEQYSVPKKEVWETTVNVSKIETTNQANNKIPDDCSVFLDIRFIPEDAKKIVTRIRTLLPKGCKMQVIAHEPSLETDAQDPYILKLQEASRSILKKQNILRGANGSSDARHFAKVGCAGIEFGPIGAGIGSDAEWVDIPNLTIYADVLRRFLLSLDQI